ncbi:Uncharacterised protein [Sphingobacterium mizutaii]|uniref:Uncharacterized protein n=1 Tax=Sphingobacterium mizutaii TaxID=1010 RepID=A0AAJ4XAA6_9SPHI|nr:Uncharacterised protein [Sphingobacterium mizutaii]
MLNQSKLKRVKWNFLHNLFSNANLRNIKIPLIVFQIVW